MSWDGDMFYGATPLIFERAKELRNRLTKHERILWKELRSNKLQGLRFKAQHPVGQYIVDFYCNRLKLVIEIDGDNHQNADQKAYDKDRTCALNEFGIKVLRFTNGEIENELTIVLEKIKSECNRARSPLKGVGGKISDENE